MKTHCDVAIIGGGPAGSTVAGFLKKFNPKLDVVIFERGSRWREFASSRHTTPRGLRGVGQNGGGRIPHQGRREVPLGRHRQHAKFGFYPGVEGFGLIGLNTPNLGKTVLAIEVIEQIRARKRDEKIKATSLTLGPLPDRAAVYWQGPAIRIANAGH